MFVPEAISSSCTQQCLMDCEVETQTVTPTTTSTSAINVCDGSLTVWVVLAILFIVIAVSPITLSIFVGYFSYKKIRALKDSLAAISASNTKEQHTEGRFACNKLLKLTYKNN